MTTIATLITHADIPEHVRDLLAVLPWAGTVAELAGRLGVTERSAYRALAAGVDLGVVERGEGGCALTPDAERILRCRCQGVGRKREAPGLEYTPVIDKEAALLDRAAYAHRTNSGPAWLRAKGAELARKMMEGNT